MPVYTKLKEISRLTIFTEQTFLTFPTDYTNILIGELYGIFLATDYARAIKSQTKAIGLHNPRKKKFRKFYLSSWISQTHMES